MVILLILIGIPLFFVLQNQPSCFDGEQNGDEWGVDCGGVCALYCPFQITPPSVLWSRSFEVAPGVYNAIAYVDNPNFQAGTMEVSYSFKLFDERNILVAERVGKTFIAPSKTNPIFEGGIQTGERIPVRTFFELTGAPIWLRFSNQTSLLSTSQYSVRDEEFAPKLDVRLTNASPAEDVRDVEVVATAFGEDGNAIGVSRTVVDLLERDSTVPLVFTWPTPFGAPATRFEIIPRLSPRE